VTQTSAVGYGQIYVGSVNWLLMIFTLGLTVGFGSSDKLAAAFGIAVSLTMLLTTLLMYKIMREQWRWPLALAIAVAGSLALVDASFAAANLTKVTQGGWVPLVTASLLFLLMEAWHSGRNAMLGQLERETMPLGLFIESMAGEARIAGTAVYLSRRADVVPVAMLHSVKHYHVLHQRNVILSVETEHVPRVDAAERASVTALGSGFYRVALRYGFMQQPDIPAALAHCSLDGEGFDEMETTFFLSRVSVCSTAVDKERINPLFCRIFAWLHRNEADATEFFRIPRNRIVELGAQIAL
jgi:KUP system potassium uptake protein